ncbi:hypothetical protein GCM10017786_76080 [Amycolatopsis deserti]|uniref:Uncharacterized protein n=1 Tax=Amycolatopsis deserti TaxID=185696 RepID=A0ABQ3JI76_9PSEU|nr:hypothetical protein GCM10017786_76080 [Amycolatopsis deserti]
MDDWPMLIMTIDGLSSTASLAGVERGSEIRVVGVHWYAVGS